MKKQIGLTSDKDILIFVEKGEVDEHVYYKGYLNTIDIEKPIEMKYNI